MYSCVFLRLYNLYNRELGTTTLPGHPCTFNIHSFYQSTTHNTIANQAKPTWVNLAPTTFSQPLILKLVLYLVLVFQNGTICGTGVSNCCCTWYWYLKLVLVSQTGTIAFGRLCLLVVYWTLHSMFCIFLHLVWDLASKHELICSNDLWIESQTNWIGSVPGFNAALAPIRDVELGLISNTST